MTRDELVLEVSTGKGSIVTWVPMDSGTVESGGGGKCVVFAIGAKGWWFKREPLDTMLARSVQTPIIFVPYFLPLS